ncbi:hypothetical protein ACF3NA_07800 [Alkanindiges sp. WGS2144]|uniref:hypothetical protein n=1 Tax=Alkanindiges sp. WGS2144 TaxID=3366808 RepID=UPI0037535688
MMWKKYDWPALFTTFALIVIVREFCVWLMGLIHHPELGNLVGLLLLLVMLITWRRIKPLPIRLLDANTHIMKESAFAFLPISAGSILMLTHLGDELPWFLFILIFSTLISLWIYAYAAKHWMSSDKSSTS